MPETRSPAQSPLANNSQQLRRDILEIVAKGGERARVSQGELSRQGERLRKSLKDAQAISGQTTEANQRVDELIDVAKQGRFRRLCCCCSSCCKQNNRQSSSKLLPPKSQDTSHQVDETSSGVELRKLNKVLAQKEGKESWRRTLEPEPGAGFKGTDIWYRQVEAGLSQLQQMAEEMGESLEEQVRLAKMLTIYLNHGVEQMMSANLKLDRAQKESTF